MHNLELKARYESDKKAIAAAESLGIEPEWTRTQVDTYYRINDGKLKLRQVDGQPAELISYKRPAIPNAKLSDYVIYTTSRGDELNTALAHVLDIEVRVRKKRTLYVWENVRIHIDNVASLGHFIEFEAVLRPDDNLETVRQRLDFLCKHFDIDGTNLLRVGYYELMKMWNSHA